MRISWTETIQAVNCVGASMFLDDDDIDFSLPEERSFSTCRRHPPHDQAHSASSPSFAQDGKRSISSMKVGRVNSSPRSGAKRQKRSDDIGCSFLKKVASEIIDLGDSGILTLWPKQQVYRFFPFSNDVTNLLNF